jgi:phage repressor protein C with HTH and peptisase S24 domain
VEFSRGRGHGGAVRRKSEQEVEALDPVRKRIYLAADGSDDGLANWSRAMGRNHAYLTQFIWRGTPRKLDEDDRKKLAAASGIPETDLGKTPDPELNNVTPIRNEQAVANRNDHGLEFLGTEGARRFEGPKDLPILGHVKAGANGLFYDQGSVQGVTMRPDYLEGVRAAYAVRVRDMSMYPAYEPNDLVHVNPTLAVLPDNNVVIQLRNGEAFVKRLIRRTEKAVICQEWFPEKRDIRYDPKEVQFIHMIVRPR